jgi:hypothetical protein
MQTIQAIAVTVGMAAAFVVGLVIGRPRSVPTPSPREILQAQETANKYLPPFWRDKLRDDPKLKQLRDQGFAYCFRGGSIVLTCARKQDEAIQAVFFAIDISERQQKMTDQSSLSLREREVANNPQLRVDVLAYCSNLYADHGNQDARVLAVCLGNLSEFSPLIAIPVP